MKPIDFNFFLPVNLVFGAGKTELAGTKTAAFGKCALIVTGGNSTKKSGLLNRIELLLNKSGVDFVIFDEVTPNPLTTTAEKGARIARENGCDVVVGIGGGSSIDAAKGIAFMAANDGDINDFIFGRRESALALPLIAIPTTCGTGTEGNGFAVLTNPDTLDKKSLRCAAVVPACSIIDPELMKTMPKAVLASVGFDALCHNIDAYVAVNSQPLTDLLALYGAELVAGSLPACMAGGDDADWERLTLGSTLGGMVIGIAGVSALHALEHPVSGLRNAVHGRGLASLAPYVYSRSIAGAPKKFARLSAVLGGKNEKDFVEKISGLISGLELDKPLGEYGFTQGDVPWLTENCMKVSAPSIKNSFVVFDKKEIAEIYSQAI